MSILEIHDVHSVYKMHCTSFCELCFQRFYNKILRPSTSFDWLLQMSCQKEGGGGKLAKMNGIQKQNLQINSASGNAFTQYLNISVGCSLRGEPKITPGKKDPFKGPP